MTTQGREMAKNKLYKHVTQLKCKIKAKLTFRNKIRNKIIKAGFIKSFTLELVETILLC